jgi:hypothetical protein
MTHQVVVSTKIQQNSPFFVYFRVDRITVAEHLFSLVSGYSITSNAHLKGQQRNCFDIPFYQVLVKEKGFTIFKF